VTMHFAQVAFGFSAAGAAILIVAGLVREAVHDKKRTMPVMAARDDPVKPEVNRPLESSAAFRSEEPAAETLDASGTGGSRERDGKRRVSGDNDPEAARRRKKRRANRSDGDRRARAEERKRRRARDEAVPPVEASES